MEFRRETIFNLHMFPYDECACAASAAAELLIYVYVRALGISSFLRLSCWLENVGSRSIFPLVYGVLGKTISDSNGGER
jgi:hypothetical protein